MGGGGGGGQCDPQPHGPWLGPRVHVRPAYVPASCGSRTDMDTMRGTTQHFTSTVYDHQIIDGGATPRWPMTRPWPCACGVWIGGLCVRRADTPPACVIRVSQAPDLCTPGLPFPQPPWG